MHIIKLSAIDSTSSYLKKLLFEKKASKDITVVAENQFAGRGQMGSVWEVENGKNLTFSTLITISNFKISDQFYLSMAISIAIYEVIKSLTNNSINIKWPNDILADKDKIAGILIENTIRGENITNSIVGVGLNVNQQQFPKNLKNVTSLSILKGCEFNLDTILLEILNKINFYKEFILRKEFKTIKNQYMSCLYKYNIPSMFEDKPNNNFFLGKIVDVFEDGKIGIELENGVIRKFSFKEIKFANIN